MQRNKGYVLMIDNLISALCAVLTKNLTPIDAVLMLVIFGLTWMLKRKESQIDHKDELLQKAYDDLLSGNASLKDIIETLKNIILVSR